MRLLRTVVDSPGSSILEHDIRIQRIVEVGASLAESHAFNGRATLDLVERGGAHRSLLCVHEVGIDVALALVSLVNDFHVSRNFTLDTRVGLVPHLAFLFLLLRTPPHIVDGAANDLCPLILFDVLFDVHRLVMLREAHVCSLLASRELLLIHTDVHRLLLLEQRLGFLRAIHT